MFVPVAMCLPIIQALFSLGLGRLVSNVSRYLFVFSYLLPNNDGKRCTSPNLLLNILVKQNAIREKRSVRLK